MKFLCINNRNKPNEIPNDIWEKLKEGEEYTVIEMVKCNVQGGILGYKLEEIQLDNRCSPYECFAAYRFALPKEMEEVQENEELLVI